MYRSYVVGQPAPPPGYVAITSLPPDAKEVPAPQVPPTAQPNTRAPPEVKEEPRAGTNPFAFFIPSLSKIQRTGTEDNPYLWYFLIGGIALVGLVIALK